MRRHAFSLRSFLRLTTRRCTSPRSPAARHAVEDGLASAADRLGRLVNPILIDQGEWDRSATPFLQTLRSRPLVELPLAVRPDAPSSQPDGIWGRARATS